jgi:hypothetical protein
MAVAACKREIGETAEIVSGFPPSENNLQAIDLLRRESLALNQQAADADRAATEAVARFAAAVATRMGKGLESSRSVESKIAAADALISAMQEILDFVIVGQGNEINQQILAVVENMLGWLETADRQPWDRV